jgi:hypothetical protein
MAKYTIEQKEEFRHIRNKLTNEDIRRLKANRDELMKQRQTVKK